MRTRAAYFGIFTALALILGYVELLIPIHFGIPGAKLGLANLNKLLIYVREVLLLLLVDWIHDAPR